MSFLGKPLNRYGLLLGGLLALTAPSMADQPRIAADNAFDRYVDPGQLLQAWVDKNAPLLADLGLQLAEGERVLFRSHKSITADQVLAAAVKVAAERRDLKTLGRLAKALDALKKTELAGEVALAQKLASASRTISPALAVPVDAMPPDIFLLFRDTLESIISAKLAGDGETLDIIIQLTPKMTRLPEARRKYLVKMASDARASLQKEGIDPGTAAFNKLLADSRDAGRRETLESPRIGVKYLRTAKGLRVVGLTKDAPIGLTRGDLILRVGDETCYADGVDLNELVNGAYKSGNPQLLVYETATRQVRTLDLPPRAEAVPRTGDAKK